MAESGVDKRLLESLGELVVGYAVKVV